MNGELKYKADVIAEVLRRIAQKHPEQDMAEIEADSVMIGDRVHDIEGAKKCKIESVGVRFGFAKPGELEEAGQMKLWQHRRNCWRCLGKALKIDIYF